MDIYNENLRRFQQGNVPVCVVGGKKRERSKYDMNGGCEGGYKVIWNNIRGGAKQKYLANEDS